MSLNQKEIGKRISELRKFKGYSQQELANKLEISRPVVTQIELGNRSLSVQELIKISHIFSVTIDEFLSENFLKSKIIQTTTNKPEPVERVSIPSFKLDKFKNILLYILENCAGKPNVGETLLNKLLYFSDFNYYEIYEEHLSGATYKKFPFGPVPQDLDSVLDLMIKNKELRRITTEYHGYTQKRYLPLEKPDLSFLSANEKKIIDDVILRFSDWTASAISEYSHKDMPWLATETGKEIDYELVFYREQPFSVRNYE